MGKIIINGYEDVDTSGAIIIKALSEAARGGFLSDRSFNHVMSAFEAAGTPREEDDV